jgi:hypothetical protein
MMLAKKLAPFSQAGFLKTGVALASRWPAPSIAVDRPGRFANPL